MAIKARGFQTYFKGNLADFNADTRIWPEAVLIFVEDAEQIRFGDGLNEFSDLPPIYKQDMTPAQKLVLIGTTVPETAIPSSIADLATARTIINQLRTDSEARLEVIEAKVDALIGHLITSGEMSAT